MLINIIRILLIPFAFIYGFIIEIRNWFYNLGILNSTKYNVPVISIGNITAGGTGKTPFTIYLAELLKDSYPKIAVISRGYGRKSKGMQLVSDGQQILLDPSLAGDEPYLIASQLPECLVAVSEERNVAFNYLIENYKPDLIILDDAFQHRLVQRDIDIVLINAKENLQSKLLLPAGNLREFRHNLKRADMIVQTNKNMPGNPDIKKLTKYTGNIYSCFSKVNHLVDLEMQTIGALSDLGDEPVFIFAGIAYPENFRIALTQKGVLVKGFQSYADHYDFTLNDLKDLIIRCHENNCRTLLCTEKDLVKFFGLQDVINALKSSGIRLLGVRLELEINQREKLLKNILSLLDNNI